MRKGKEEESEGGKRTGRNEVRGGKEDIEEVGTERKEEGRREKDEKRKKGKEQTVQSFHRAFPFVGKKLKVTLADLEIPRTKKKTRFLSI